VAFYLTVLFDAAHVFSIPSFIFGKKLS